MFYLLIETHKRVGQIVREADRVRGMKKEQFDALFNMDKLPIGKLKSLGRVKVCSCGCGATLPDNGRDEAGRLLSKRTFK